MFKKKTQQNHRICNTSKKKILMIQIKIIYTKKKQLKNSLFLKIQQVNNIQFQTKRGYIVYWYVN